MELCLLTFPALLGTSQPASQPARPGSWTDLVQYPQSGLAPNTLQQYSQWSLLSLLPLLSLLSSDTVTTTSSCLLLTHWILI